MNTPDLNLLPVFEALLRHGNVTRAAAHMGLTQSAMSSALGRLRRQLGDELFVNTRGGMLPTPRALELAPSLTDALAMVRSALGAREAFDPRRTTRSLRVYMTDVGDHAQGCVGDLSPPIVAGLPLGEMCRLASHAGVCK